MVNKFNDYNTYDWYKDIIDSLRDAFLSNYKKDNELKMKLLAQEVEKSIDLIANEYFLEFLNHEITRIATTNNSKESLKNDLLFYQALALILSHNLNKSKIKNQIESNEAKDLIESYKNRVWQLLNLRLEDQREIEKMKSESDFFAEKLEEIVQILLRSWIDWKNIKLEDVVNKFFGFWEISKILNIRFPDEKITDDVLVEKIEKLWHWYETMRILINHLINKGVILKVNWWSYKINSTIEGLLKNEKIIRPSKKEDPREERKTSSVIKAWTLNPERLETFELTELEEESQLDKANKEIERLRQELIKSQIEKQEIEKKALNTEVDLKAEQKKVKKLEKQKKALKKELLSKWRSEAEIKKIIEAYEENS